jgi:hypothetical protein
MHFIQHKNKSSQMKCHLAEEPKKPVSLPPNKIKVMGHCEQAIKNATQSKFGTAMLSLAIKCPQR